MIYHATCKIYPRKYAKEKLATAVVPFRKGSLAFLRHLENFWPFIESVLIKKKENRNPGSNPDLSYPCLSSLTLHFHNDLPKFRKTVFLNEYINSKWT